RFPCATEANGLDADLGGPGCAVRHGPPAPASLPGRRGGEPSPEPGRGDLLPGPHLLYRPPRPPGRERGRDPHNLQNSPGAPPPLGLLGVLRATGRAPSGGGAARPTLTGPGPGPGSRPPSNRAAGRGRRRTRSETVPAQSPRRPGTPATVAALNPDQVET